MKLANSSLVMCVGLSIGLVGFSAHAEQAGVNVAAQTQERFRELAHLTMKEMQLVQSGLKHFYVNSSGAWPTSLASINTYYSGEYGTPIGKIQGIQVTNGYELYIDTANLDPKLKAMLSTELAKQSGGFSGNRVVMRVEAPQAAAIVRSSLSRFADPSGTGELNTMYTDLLMNGNNLDGVNDLNASNVIANSATISQLTNTQLTSDSATIGNAAITQANLTNASIDSALIDAATIDMATIDTAAISMLNGNVATIDSLTSTTANVTSATIGDAQVNVLDANSLKAVIGQIDDLSIANALSVQGSALFGGAVSIGGDANLAGSLYSNGTLVVDRVGKVYYEGQDLDARFLGITDTATNADMLGGVNSANFARRDVANVFAAPQTFNNGITVSGSGIKTNTLDASGNIYTNNMYVKSRSTWISSVIDSANDVKNRVGALENSLASQATTGTWRFVGGSNNASWAMSQYFSGNKSITVVYNSVTGMKCPIKGEWAAQSGEMCNGSNSNNTTCTTGLMLWHCD